MPGQSRFLTCTDCEGSDTDVLITVEPSIQGLPDLPTEFGTRRSINGRGDSAQTEPQTLPKLQ